MQEHLKVKQQVKSNVSLWIIGISNFISLVLQISVRSVKSELSLKYWSIHFTECFSAMKPESILETADIHTDTPLTPLQSQFMSNNYCCNKLEKKKEIKERVREEHNMMTATTAPLTCSTDWSKMEPCNPQWYFAHINTLSPNKFFVHTY